MQLLVEDEERYHARRGELLTSHKLALYRRAPIFYKLGESKIDSPALKLGRALHCLVLEPGEFGGRYQVASGPVNPRTGRCYGADTKKYAEWLQSIPAGIDILTADEDATVRRMAANIAMHPEASRILAGPGQAEGVARCDVEGHHCQARIDWLSDAWLCDLKTCRNLDAFYHDAKKFGYVYQLAFYAMMVEAFTGESHCLRSFGLVAVESQAPYRAGVWVVPHDSIDRAIRQNRQLMQSLHRSVETDSWPTGFDGPRVIELEDREVDHA